MVFSNIDYVFLLKKDIYISTIGYTLSIAISQAMCKDKQLLELHTAKEAKPYSFSNPQPNAKNGISKNADLEGERTFGEDNTIPDYFKNTIYVNALLTNAMSSNNTIAEVLKLYLFKPITSEGENYVIKINNSTVYINKETKFITKSIIKGSTSKDISAYENTIDFNNISENDVSKDNLYK